MEWPAGAGTNQDQGKAEQLMDQAKEVDPQTVAAAEQAVVTSTPSMPRPTTTSASP